MTTVGLREHLTHRGNLRSSRFGWLRLTPMYSVHLVDELLDDAGDVERVLDPYCGTGTTALVCAERGTDADTLDINPFLLWLTRAKTQVYEPEEIAAASTFARVVEEAILTTAGGCPWIPAISNIERWWGEDTLAALARAWDAIGAAAQVGSQGSSDLLAIAFLRIVIRTASVSFGHQSMSFRGRAGEVARAQLSLEGGRAGVVAEEWSSAVREIAAAAASPIATQPRAVLGDARDLTALGAGRYDLVITSPPYCNRMSYIRELRPYMYWLGYLKERVDAAELDWQAIGGTWGSATSRVGRWMPTDADPKVRVDGFDLVVAGIARSSDLLARYVHKYFTDTARHVASLPAVLNRGARVNYIIGNSKFYDTLVPTEAILASLLREARFDDIEVRVIRKRTSKKELFEYLVSARWDDEL
ncbi:MAG: hypothetical protein MSC30_19320 [Gaiellaceae bacterium MAG52_C11]|nr:hypothetical protein [Candidatus Gaiellasilicea maunaloa]